VRREGRKHKKCSKKAWYFSTVRYPKMLHMLERLIFSGNFISSLNGITRKRSRSGENSSINKNKLTIPKKCWVEKRGSVGVPLPASNEKCGFKLLSRVRTQPPVFVQESSSKAGLGFFGTCSSGKLPLWASPSTTIPDFLDENKVFV
jgi:hypothetical protein